MATTPTPKKITVNGKQFELRRMRIFDAAEVQAYIVANIAPVFAGRDVSPGNLAAANIFILRKVLATVLWFPGGEFPAPRELSDEAAIEDAFGFDMETMYQVVWEMLEYNRFPFFEKVKAFIEKAKTNIPSGNGTTEIDGSKRPTPNVPKTSKPLDTLET